MSVAPPRTTVLKRYAQHTAPSFFWSRLLVGVLIVGVFGPYITGSVRSEQLAVYALAPLLVFTFVRLKAWSISLLSAWIFSLVVVTLGHLLRSPGMTPWESGSALSGYDSLLLPLVVMVLIWTLVPVVGAVSVLRTAGILIALLTALNAIVAVASSMVPNLVTYLHPFWSAEAGDAGSVGELAMTMGRFSGVFNQPAEAGLVYSIAAVLTVWVFSKQRRWMYPLLALITIGGMLSVSKVFLLVGLPVAIALLLFTQKIAGWIGIFLAGGLLTIVLGTASFFQQWTGLDYLTRLLEIPENQSIFQFYSAGRWTEGSAVLEVADFVLGASPLFGMGIAGLAVPYDSLWTEAIVLGGVLMVVAMVVVFGALIWAFRKIPDKNLRLTSYAFWAVLVGASFGIPSLTTNRAATIVWIVAALLVAISTHTRSEKAQEPPQAPGATIAGRGAFTALRRKTSESTGS